jgi:hypothetical protein
MDKNDLLRGNPKLKAANVSEIVAPSTLMDRLSEMQRIMEDPIYFAEKYFYITTLDNGTQLIKVYPKQAEMINAMCKKNRTIVLSARQTRKIDIVFHIRAMVCLDKQREEHSYLR